MRRRTAAQRGRQKRARPDDDNDSADAFPRVTSTPPAVDELEAEPLHTSGGGNAPSAAAATDMRDELKARIHSCQRTERSVDVLLRHRAASNAAVEAISSSQNIAPSEMVRLNVGDEIFTVPLQLLRSAEGTEMNFFDVLLESFGESHGDSTLQPPLADESGAVFIDRDPKSFRLVLNYLRGYRFLNFLSEDQITMLKADARYYQLRGLMELLGEQATDNRIQFRQGPGVNPERSRLRVVYGVAVVGQRFLITGRHSITFQIINSDYVGIGLVSDSCVSTDQEFHKTSNCCVYYMTGVFYSNFPHHRKEDGLESLEKDDYVSLTVDMNKRVAEYTLKNSTKTISLGNARKLRFAVTMKMGSSVRIIPDAEARQLPLFQPRGASHGQSLLSHAASALDDRDAFTQLSQPNGAGSLTAPAIEPPSTLSALQLQARQAPQGGTGATLPMFLPRGVEGTSRSAMSALGLPLDVRRRAIVVGTIQSNTIINEMGDLDPILFGPGAHERRDGM